jgi:hypothetical protein
VDAGATKAFDLRVEVPVEDMSRPAAPSARQSDGQRRRRAGRGAQHLAGDAPAAARSSCASTAPRSCS